MLSRAFEMSSHFGLSVVFYFLLIESSRFDFYIQEIIYMKHNYILRNRIYMERKDRLS